MILKTLVQENYLARSSHCVGLNTILFFLLYQFD
jgi:hypothetical protein